MTYMYLRTSIAHRREHAVRARQNHSNADTSKLTALGRQIQASGNTMSFRPSFAISEAAAWRLRILIKDAGCRASNALGFESAKSASCQCDESVDNMYEIGGGKEGKSSGEKKLVDFAAFDAAAAARRRCRRQTSEPKRR